MNWAGSEIVLASSSYLLLLLLLFLRPLELNFFLLLLLRFVPLISVKEIQSVPMEPVECVPLLCEDMVAVAAKGTGLHWGERKKQTKCPHWILFRKENIYIWKELKPVRVILNSL